MTDPRSPLGPGGSHPEEALAAFTDGSATADERALVLQHLQGCAECRAEVELARGALVQLSRLPEPPAPGLDPEAIVRRAGPVTGLEGSGRSGDGRRRFGAVAAGLAAAAVVAALFAGLIQLNKGGSNSTAASGSSPTPAAGPKGASPEIGRLPGVDYGRLTTDFTPSSIDQLAMEEAGATDAGGQAAGPSPRHMSSELASSASSCAARTAEGARVVRIIEASFQGRPAFVTVLRRGGDQPAVRVVVTDRTTCAVLYSTTRPAASG